MIETLSCMSDGFWSALISGVFSAILVVASIFVFLLIVALIATMVEAWQRC